MDFKNLLYSLACMAFTVVIGGAVYEHAAVVPQWSAAPPQSLSMFQGDYGLKAETFWIWIHPVTLLLLFATLATSWKSARRNAVLTTLGGYLLVLAVTATVFVPELIAITTTSFSETVDADLVARASWWETASQIRMVFLMGLGLVLFNGLTKSGESRS